MLYPVTPIFLSAVLGASMTQLGLIEGLADAVSQLLKAYSGLWSDRIANRKSFILIGYSLSAVAKPLIGVADGVFGVLLARSCDRVGKGIRVAPRDALIADSLDGAADSGAAFGWHRLMDTLGAFVGPLVTLLLLSKFQMPLRSIYFWTIIPGLLAVIAILFLREATPKVQIESRGLGQMTFDLSQLRIGKDLKHFIFYFSLFSLANSSDAFLILQAKNVGISTENTLLLYCGYNLVYAALSPVLGRIADRKPKKNVLAFGFVVYALVYSGFAFAREPSHFALLFAAYGFYMAATDGVGKAFTVELCDKENRGAAIGLLSSATGLSSIIASLMFGIIWDRFGSGPAFMVCAATALLAALLFAFRFPGRNHAI